jgi:hypothetical protein
MTQLAYYNGVRDCSVRGKLLIPSRIEVGKELVECKEQGARNLKDRGSLGVSQDGRRSTWKRRLRQTVRIHAMVGKWRNQPRKAVEQHT